MPMPSNEHNKTPPPRDPYKFVLFTMAWIGVTSLLPWNIFVTVHEYWMYKLRNVTDTTEVKSNTDMSSASLNDLQTRWASYLSISSMVPNVMCLFLVVACCHKFSINLRLLLSKSLIFLVLLISIILSTINTDQWQNGFLAITLVGVVFMSISMATIQGGLAGLAATFPSSYMSATVQGQAIGGVIACLMNIGILVTGADAVFAAFQCFILAEICVVSSAVMLVLITKLKFYKFYSEAQNEYSPSLLEEVVDCSPARRSDNSFKDILIVIKKLKIWIIAAILNFAVTLSVFPALTSIVTPVNSSQSSEWNSKYFIPVGCFLIFNIGDYVGRLLAGLVQIPKNTKLGSYSMLIAALFRISFIPLFLLSNIKPGERVYTDVYIGSDVAYLVFMVIFSLSNGYIGNICMMFGPKTLSIQKEQMIGGTVVMTGLVLGLAIGSGLSSFLLKLL